MTSRSDRTPHPRRDSRRAITVWWRSWEWPAIGALTVVGVALGYVGFLEYFKDAPAWHRHPWEMLYRTIQLLPLQFGWFDKPLHWTLQVARLLLPALAVYAAVKGLAALYFDQLQVLRVRLFARGHTIICGLGQKGLLLARRLRALGMRVVVIEQDEENDLIRVAREAGCIVLVGDATEPYMLRRAGVRRAHCLVAVSRDDGLNAEVSTRALELAGDSNRELQCTCHVFSSQLRQLLDRHQPETDPWRMEHIRFFNVYEDGARLVLDLDPPFGPDLSVGPHILILGIGRMGEALLVRLAEIWQMRRNTANAKLRITLGDRIAPEKKGFLLSAYPNLADVWELDPVRVEVKSPEFRAGSLLYDGERFRSLTRAYVCFDDESLGLAAALTIEDRLRARGRHVPVVLRTRAYGGLAVLLPRVDETGCPPDCLRVFGLYEHTCTPEAIIARR